MIMQHFFNISFLRTIQFKVLMGCLMASFLWAHQSQAQNSTHTITYQGFLYENGQPFTGKKDFVFSLLNTEVVWTETQSEVDVDAGRYTVVLGVVEPLQSSIFENASNLALQIEVDGVVLSPNVTLHSVPYAIHAARASQAEHANYASQAKLADNATTAGHATRADSSQYANTAGHAKTAEQILDTPSFDSQWFSIDKNCNTYAFKLGFNGLPKRITAYYKLSTGQILPYGMSQYGDGAEANGVLLDLDELGNLYVRLPCGNTNNNSAVKLGSFKDRQNDGNQTMNNQAGVQFRVMVWK
jgi:hypothetical protein